MSVVQSIQVTNLLGTAIINHRQKQRVYPKSLALQVGSKRISPDELTQVSDSGA
ncbi:hypothetical protein ykris0001_28000 [Yersinia kristensenii ATCC 33638]|nr:hypothetical protein ykris0001_28000 [Yersinia kristensenii ATCC 33638]